MSADLKVTSHEPSWSRFEIQYRGGRYKYRRIGPVDGTTPIALKVRIGAPPGEDHTWTELGLKEFEDHIEPLATLFAEVTVIEPGSPPRPLSNGVFEYTRENS